MLGSVMVVATSLNDYREDFAAQGILPSFRASSRTKMMYAVNRVATVVLAPLSVPAAVQSIGATSSVCTSLPGMQGRIEGNRVRVMDNPLGGGRSVMQPLLLIEHKSV